jgi:hypothetical protein
MKGGFATRVAGSADLYHNHARKPYHGINFVVAHDGFSLYDLVAYNQKHNHVRRGRSAGGWCHWPARVTEEEASLPSTHGMFCPLPKFAPAFFSTTTTTRIIA